MKRALVLCWSIFVTAITAYAIPYADSLLGYLYLSLLSVLQATILLLPALLVYQLSRVFQSKAIYAIFHFLVIGSLIALIANYKLHSMYNFFVDGFVINLMITPGGIDALGLSPSFYVSSAILVAVALALYVACVTYLPLELLTKRIPEKRYIAALIFGILLTETATFAFAAYTSDRQILAIANRVIWHIPVSARGFYERLGVKQSERQLDEPSRQYTGDLVYPPVGILQSKADRPLNIVWLTAESLRSDMLTEEIMPQTYAFSKNNSRFNQHYSGGNGTRLGMFSQFYGLYGSYWFTVLENRKSPLLIDTLIANDYDMTAFTSARFTYPEFDKTIFSRIPKTNLHEYYKGKGWQRDEKNTEDLVQHLAKVSKEDKPFFTFMFFESSHANYYFPETHVIRDNYLDDFDYLSVDIGENIDMIKNRYINASHYLDSRLGMVFKALKENHLEDNTIVIVTGDHGEEFMEKGRWGHNSTFVQEQIQVPLVLRIPGENPRVIQTMTSHLDLPATVLHALGYTEDPQFYSFGRDLLSSTYDRQYTVASDWHGNVLITPDVKILLTLKGSGNSSSLTTLNDKAIKGEDLRLQDKEFLRGFIKELPKFYLGSPAYQENAQMLDLKQSLLLTKTALLSALR